MKSWKMVTTMIVIFVISSVSCGCAGIVNGFYKVTRFDEISIGDVDAITKKYIPNQYVDLFNHYTVLDDDLETINFRLQVIAIGMHETGWTNVTSEPNKNGTYDVGYMQLNSGNISNPEFMNRFGPLASDAFSYNTSDVQSKYLITCIKYYKALYKVYGENAVYCYNAGETRYRKNQLPVSTLNYKFKVKQQLDSLIIEIKENIKYRNKWEKEREKNEKLENDPFVVTVKFSN